MSEIKQPSAEGGWKPYLRASSANPQPWSKGMTWTICLWALAITVAVTLMWGVPRVENRLDGLSRARLQNAGIDTSTLNLRWNYRDLQVHGNLPAGVSKEQLADVLRQGHNDKAGFFARGIRRIDVQAKQASRSAPAMVVLSEGLSVNMVMQRNTGTLDGVVETEEQRQLLVESLLASGIENVVDNLDVVENTDATADAKVEVLAAMLRNTESDQVARFFANLDKRRLDYHVSTYDRASASTIENSADVAIVNFDISGEATVAQTGLIDVQLISEESQLIMRGQVLTDDQRQRLVFAAREAASENKSIIDELTVSDQAARNPGSDARIDALAQVVANLKDGVSGRVNMRGAQLNVDSITATDALRSNLVSAATSAQEQGVSVSQNIRSQSDIASETPQDSADILQSKLDELTELVRETVNFNSGNAELTEVAIETLDIVAEVLRAYPEHRVDIEGHTDNVGRAAVNEDLSRRRAQSVREYLIGQSVAASRLVAVGYGERLPIDTNDTSEGRQRNRRVHFTVPDTTSIEQ